MRVIGFLLAGALLLAGCTEDKPREPDPTSKPSPTATAPSMPAAAQENTQAGAIAFVKHYIQLLNYSSDTGDISRLSEASDTSCAGCAEYVSLYEKTYKDGGYFRDSGWITSEISSETQSGELLVFASVNARGGSFRRTADSQTQRSRDETYDLIFAPVVKDGRWVVSRFARESGE